MLNISHKRINDKVEIDKFSAFRILDGKSVRSNLIYVLACLGLIVLGAMFLPWTQNVRSKGYVTTLNPQDRPQDIQTLIAGKIERWYVREGDVVAAGDTIMKISEVKEEYLDPEILARTNSQIVAKNESKKAYIEKARNLANQNKALAESREAKLAQNEIKREQTLLKLQSDSIDFEAASIKLEIAKNQLGRIQGLYDAGIKSLTDLEGKRLSVQEANAKVVALDNKLRQHRNELRNLFTNQRAIINEYADKIAKSKSDQMTAISNQYNAEASVNKLQSQYNSYEQRQRNYYIKSPITGRITKAKKEGIGGIIKNGDNIVSILPVDYQLAIEMYVLPQDVPLIKKGQKVRIQFDGWPAIVFSGWPNNSFGTFGGKVYAIDQFISDNGKYRVLVAADPDEKPWPKQVQVGGGANSITLLNDVRLGYEVWRQLNGFPPDYYEKSKAKEVKTKAPLRSVK